MKLIPASLEDLSNIRYEVHFPECVSFDSAEFVHIGFRGKYRDGASGRADAQFLNAIVGAVDSAWQVQAFVIDLTNLAYQWGDEMQCIWDIGYERWCRSHRPLAVIVGDLCGPALKTLDRQEFDRFAVTTLDDAIASIRKQQPVYQESVRGFMP